MKIFLDDERKTPEGFKRCYWPDEVIALISSRNDIELISLDHDLGDDDRGTGYDVLKWIEKQVVLNNFIPTFDIIVHSANPPAFERMTEAIKAINYYVSMNPNL